MRKYFWIFFLPLFINAQNESEEYRSANNKYYWKNRKPNAAYWQQDVHYDIKAILNDPANIVEGYEELTYFNNSPDELGFVYFHLYNNANTKDSYLADQYKNNNIPLHFGSYRAKGLGTTVESIAANAQELKTELDNTILKVWLPVSLKSGESITLKLKFKTFFDNETIRNRMKAFMVSGGYKHFDLVQWYPRISVYDAKQGWDTDQHMDREYYGDFGSFNVELMLPNHYICDGTGVLQNPKEVYPGDLRQRLDIKNFARKEWNSAPSEIVKPDGTFKTWKFSAINVHDVGYTFDPTYRIGEVITKDSVHCISLAQEMHAGRWQNAADYTAKIIETNSKNIGQFAYPKMIVADARGGTEFPMMTLDDHDDPGYRGLFIHEISHNWFYGMVGNNETYRAFMDEGFTQFYTCDTWENIEGVNNIFPNIKSAYVRNHTDSTKARETNAYGSYMGSVMRGEEHTLNTHSDYFNVTRLQNSGYGQVYTKTAVMLYNLRYVLGDSLFKAGMHNYFEQWKFCHPYPEDFRNSITQTAHTNLNWFFDEWLETAKTVDYSVKKVKKIRGEADQYKITIKRKGKIQMPIDFSVYTTDRSQYNFYIPNTWFEKKTDARILPRWIGWDKVKPVYTATISIPKEKKISKIVLDTAHILPDVWPVNNAFPKNISWFNFDSKVANAPDRNKYQTFFRPALWYNGYDGAKVGMNINGNYMNVKGMFDLTVWLNTGAGQNYLDSGLSINSHDVISFLFNYKTPTTKILKGTSFYTTLKELDGLSSGLVGLDVKHRNEKTRFYAQYKAMLRDVRYDNTYLIYKNEWLTGLVNSYASFGMDHNYKYSKGNGAINLNFRAPFFGDYDFSSVTLSAVNKNYLGKVGVHTRLFAQYGYGNKVPFESMLFVAGANPEEMMENKYTRSMGIFQPFAFGTTTNNFCYGGGLNLRGYMGYLLPQVDDAGMYRYNYKGTSGAAYNMEIDFGRLFGFVDRATKQSVSFSPYLFGDAGVIQTNYNFEKIAFTDVMVDAGAGVALTINKFWKLQNIKPLTIRADFPVFINRLPYEEKDYLQFRWMIGVSRAF
ncbi:MAG: M1 family metallopeptidase [Bacteroidia bacterium]